MSFSYGIAQTVLFFGCQKAIPHIIFFEEFHSLSRIGIYVAVSDCDVEDSLNEGQFSIDCRRFNRLPPCRYIALNVAWEDLSESFTFKRLLPYLRVTGVVAVAAMPSDSPEKIVYHVGDRNFATPLKALGKEPALLNLGFALLINLEGETLRTDLFSVNPAILVRVTCPPNSRTPGALENTPVSIVRSSRANILMMESTQDRHRDDASERL